MRSKVESYVGFAIRAGKYRCGVGAVSTLKKANLLILCATAAKNTRDEAVKLAKKFHCPMILSDKYTVESLSGKENCKLMAITDASLAKAIRDNTEEGFSEFALEAR